MSKQYKMQARDSVSAEMYYWVSTWEDFGGSEYTGPNTAEEVAVLAEHDPLPTITPLLRELTVSREITAADIGVRLYSRSSSAIVLTIPEGIVLPGKRIDLAQLGTGPLSLAAKDGNITIRVKSGKGLKLDGQYSHASLIGDEDGDPDLVTLIGEVVS